MSPSPMSSPLSPPDAPSAAQPLVVCYHDSCPDGGCAAAIVQSVVPDAELVPVKYHHPLPDLAGRDVQFVDFCPEVEELVYLATHARSLEILDHHLSADDRLAEALRHPAVQAARDEDPRRFRYVFDKAVSGAMLAWQHYHGRTPPPPLVAYVQDRDLWQHRLPDTQAVSYGIFLTGMDPHSMRGMLDEDIGAIRDRGAVRLAEIQERLAYYGPRAETISFAGHQVPAVELHPSESYLRSDLGSFLNAPREDGTEAPFALIAIPAESVYKISVRGRKGPGQVNLKALAQQFGGGGHEDAASFQWPERPWVSQHAPPVPPAPAAAGAWGGEAARLVGAAVTPPGAPTRVPPTLVSPTLVSPTAAGRAGV